MAENSRTITELVYDRRNIMEKLFELRDHKANVERVITQELVAGGYEKYLTVKWNKLMDDVQVGIVR